MSAMRTATPEATWSSTRAGIESATSWVISTPRFIGPGCMITVCGAKDSIRAAFKPQKREYSRNEGKS